MIGQNNLLVSINKLIEQGFPRFTIITGQKGQGKKTIAHEISRKLSCPLVVCGIKVDEIRSMIELAYKQTEPIIYLIPDADKMSLGASQITTNAYATFEALDYAGKANFYVAKEILITPKQDFKARIMYIDSNYVSKFKMEENLM